MAAEATDRIGFVLNGKTVEVTGVPPTTTLLEWLRFERRLTGTKEGCAEGDCGACTVGIRALEPDGSVSTRAVNACIALLPTLHGCEVVTVERLAGPDGELHPVQAAMVDAHGSQCGFCTPGFVMSLWVAYRNGALPVPERSAPARAVPSGAAFEPVWRRAPAPATDRPGAPTVDDLLAGNLCRCTGYGPIVEAAHAASGLPRPAADDADAAAAPARLATIRSQATLDYRHAGRRFVAPATVDELAAAVEALPDATILSGGTDVGLWVTKRAFDPETIIFTGRCAALARIERTDGEILIGAGALHEAARLAVAGAYPDMAELLRRFGGNQVRSAGTVGGNVANGSPIGDWPPALIAAGATLVLRKGAARRELPIEDFFLAYGRQDRRPGEFVEAIRLPLPRPGTAFRAYKISKRFDSDITAVLGCFAFAFEGDRIASARIAYGGMAGIPARARAAEAALAGRPFDEAALADAGAALGRDFTPIGDMRASAGYRMTVARNLLARARIEILSPDIPTRLAGPVPLVA